MAELTDRLTGALADRYRIERHLGEGGMANVYLAEDLKHDRKVAVKVLRPELAAVLGADRFVQEIKTTASLQHPHILPLFDSGRAQADAGGQGGQEFLYYVMPYVEGETLRDKLNRETQLGIEEAVRIATEVADALDYAHRQGVIHRDIKPENILLHDGRPMVADFGIALAVSAAAGGRMTETGLSLGTPHYMSPEQATAEKEITARSDVYSLGSVLYEMLAGQPPHLGGSAQQIIMKIIAESPTPVTDLRRTVPPHVAAAVDRCLEKLPADRFESAARFAEALGNPAFTHGTMSGAAVSAGRPAGLRRLVLIAAGGGLLATGIVLGMVIRPQTTVAPPVLRFRIGGPEVDLAVDRPGVNLAGVSDVRFALSRDASKLAFVGADRTPQLYIRAMDRFEAVALPGAQGVNPFFSPDGRSLGFISVSTGQIQTASLDGGPVNTVGALPAHPASTPSWGDDGYIVFVGRDLSLYRIRASGGTAELLFDSGLISNTETAGSIPARLLYPHHLPDGTAVLLTQCAEGVVRGSGACTGPLVVFDIGTGSISELGVTGRGLYVGDGYVVFLQQGTLLGARWDENAGSVITETTPLLDGLATLTHVSISRSGTIAYLPTQGDPRTVIVEVDRMGNEQQIVAQPNVYQWVRLSPDQNRIAMVMPDLTGTNRLHVHDLRTGTTLPLTEGNAARPSWSPDGTRLAYSTAGASALTEASVYTIAADGSGPGQRLAPRGDVLQLTETSWSRDGQWVIIDGASDRDGSVGGDDIYALPTSGDGEMQVVVNSPASEQSGEVSPNGEWIAYVSDDSGEFQVYIQRFMQPGGRILVSDGPGIEPAWLSDTELTYTSDSLILARLEFGESVGVTRTALFDMGPYTRGTPSWRSYDVSRDGQRFIFTRAHSENEVAPSISVVRNWMEEVKPLIAGTVRP